jgi:hypothetical protein
MNLNKRMICPECHKLGKKSRIWLSYSTSTAVHYPESYDEKGKLINNNCNKTSEIYDCSNGHTFNKKDMLDDD